MKSASWDNLVLGDLRYGGVNHRGESAVIGFSIDLLISPDLSASTDCDNLLIGFLDLAESAF